MQRSTMTLMQDDVSALCLNKLVSNIQDSVFTNEAGLKNIYLHVHNVCFKRVY